MEIEQFLEMFWVPLLMGLFTILAYNTARKPFAHFMFRATIVVTFLLVVFPVSVDWFIAGIILGAAGVYYGFFAKEDKS